MRLTQSDRKRMRAIAEAATPGPWRNADGKVVDRGDWYVAGVLPADDGKNKRRWRRNGEHIAAAHPAAVLALLDDLDAAETLLADAMRVLAVVATMEPTDAIGHEKVDNQYAQDFAIIVAARASAALAGGTAQ